LEVRPVTGGPRKYTLNLPFPVSTNRLYKKIKPMKHHKGFLAMSDAYIRFQKTANAMFLAQKMVAGLQSPPRLRDFGITVVLDERLKGRRDCDNTLKSLLDWLQRVEIVENDIGCSRIELKWGLAPTGCRVMIEEMQDDTRSPRLNHIAG
jgi:Holliday junction resolvase RusA-like endonuclease